MISSDDGRLTHSERVTPGDLDSQHFRRCLIERRIQWALIDAQPQTDRCVTAARSLPWARHPRPVSVAAVQAATRKLKGTSERRRLVAAS